MCVYVSQCACEGGERCSLPKCDGREKEKGTKLMIDTGDGMGYSARSRSILGLNLGVHAGVSQL